jgi:undecaprenyl-diphosphatase
MFSVPPILGAADWINATFDGFDRGVTLLVHKLFELFGTPMTYAMEFISLLGKSGIFLIILSLILAFFKKTRRVGTAMCIGIALGAIFVNLYLKIAIARPRPYDYDAFYANLWKLMGQNKESDFCFPSGHTNAAFATMIPVFMLCKKRWSWLGLLFGVLMGISRIYLVVHFPSDIIGGMLTGSIAGMLGCIFALIAPRFWYRWDLLKKKKDEDEECLDLAS